MERLLAGRPQRTDGRLIKDNLWKEADVSRATMNRAVQILAEWNSRVAECDGYTPREARKNDELTALQAKLADKTRECTELHHQLDAAATAIAALHHDNTLLRQELDQRGRLVALTRTAPADAIPATTRPSVLRCKERKIDAGVEYRDLGVVGFMSVANSPKLSESSHLRTYAWRAGEYGCRGAD